MMKIKSFALAAAILVASTLSALAGSSCQYITTGAVLTAAQWNSCFQAKQNELGYTPINKAGDGMTGLLTTVAPTTSSAGFRLYPGVAPSAPTNGDLWTTSAGLYARINGATVGPFAAANSAVFAATAPLSVSFPANVVTYALDDAGVTYAKIQNLGALSVMGRAANSSGVGANISASAGGDGVLRESGSTIGFGTIATAGIANNAVTLAKLATQATNTVLGNATSGSAVPTALSMTSCSAAASAVIWTTNTGFGCNTSITAAAAPASGITGTTLASNVVTSSLTTVGALAGGSATTGFTINAANVTWSGQIPGVSVAAVANASGSPSATFGVMKADGTTITCASGVCSAVGGVATSVQVGVTTVTSGSPPAILANVAGTLSEYTVATAAQLAAGTAVKIVDAAVAVSGAVPAALTAGATVTPDLNAAYNFTLTPNQNFTLANPSNITGKTGRSFCIAITNDSTPRTITLGTSYYAPGGSANITLTASAGALDQLCGFIVTTTQINVTISKAYSH